MKDILKRKHFIVRGQSFDFAYARYLSDKVSNISKSLNERKHRLDSGTVSYRILNHWEQKGLLSTNRPEGKGWRQYSKMDIIWVNIITQLREFGYPLEKIFLVKEDLTMDNDPEAPFPLLEFYVTSAFLKVPTLLAVFSNGEAIPCTQSEFQNSRTDGVLKGHVLIINLNEILQKLNPSKDLRPNPSFIYNLSDDEVSLLAAIRLDKWSEVRIRGKHGKITLIERTEEVDTEEKIVDILRSGSYQNIDVKQEDGKIVSIKRTVKKKIE